MKLKRRTFDTSFKSQIVQMISRHGLGIACRLHARDASSLPCGFWQSIPQPIEKDSILIEPPKMPSVSTVNLSSELCWPIT